MNYSEGMFYENYLKSYLHTNTVISRPVCLPIKMASKTMIRSIQLMVLQYISWENTDRGSFSPLWSNCCLVLVFTQPCLSATMSQNTPTGRIKPSGSHVFLQLSQIITRARVKPEETGNNLVDIIIILCALNWKTTAELIIPKISKRPI